MIVVTGGSGKAGRACVSELVAHGYELCNVDLVSGSDPSIPFCQVRKRKWNVWSYIDARDAAQAFRLALEVDLKGAEVFIIANADTVMLRDNKGLLAEVFPDVPQNSSFGPNDSLFSIEKARRVLKYEPKYSWRTH